MRQPPPNWGLNPLTAALDEARENQYATFHNKPIVRDVVAIDRTLWGLLVGHIDPRPMMPMNFLLRAHSSFRAAASCAMSGQVYETTVLQRAALESAAYGLFVGDDNERGARWLNRNTSNSAKERVRTEFGFGNLRRYFESKHPGVAEAFDTIYEMLIDFGAHPNEGGFSINTSLRKEGDLSIMDTIYLHEDGMPLDFGLRNLVHVGLWIIMTFRELYLLPTPKEISPQQLMRWLADTSRPPCPWP
jgi:hypothetical protein